MKRILKRIINKIFIYLNSESFKKVFLKTLPVQYRNAAKLVYFGKFNFSKEEKALGSKIELFRASIPSKFKNTQIETYQSPHSNTFELNENKSAKPGQLKLGSLEGVAATGSNIYKGVLLRRIIEGTSRKKVLELGTNTGFSGAYILSNPNTSLVTIEGSEALCEIAKVNMKRISSDFRIMNSLFDEGIKQLKDESEKFDCVFIDGQHEREATIHYTERVMHLMNKDAIYIYDDIYWSADMNQAWKEISLKSSTAVDLFTFGIAEFSGANSNSRKYDIGDYLPRPMIKRLDW